MLLKRKRSTTELCSSPPSSATTMDISPRSVLDVPAHLHSRTFKRYRDHRPSDEEVHRKFYEWRAHHQQSTHSSSVPAEHTLGLLYSAQQRQQQQPQPALQPQQQQELMLSAEASNNQQSLHRFWNINSAPSSVDSSPALERTPLTATNCDDCGADLAGSNGEEMQVDGSVLEDTACGACGKHVCFSCSISNLGEQKRCLQCAGRRVWIGGIGWTTTSVPVC